MMPRLSPPSRVLLSASSLCAVLACAGPALGDTLINEIDGRSSGRSNPAAGDEIADFVELKGAKNDSLDGHSLLHINGFNDAVLKIIDLSGFKITSDQGLFVIGSYGTPNADLIIDSPGTQTQPFEIGSDGIALYFSPTPPPTTGTTVTATNLPAGSLKDAAVYSSGPVQDPSLPGVLTPGFGQVLERAASGTVADAAAQSASRIDDAGVARNTSNYQPLHASPGQLNPGQTGAPAAGFLTFTYGSPASTTAATITEAEGTAHKVSVTISRSAAAATPLTVTIKNKDVSEIQFPDALSTSPTTMDIVIPANQPSTTFDITARDDSWKDGDQWAYFTASATGLIDAGGWVKVTDSSTQEAKVLINEVHAHLFGDADTNGTTDDKDQFVELLNVSGAPLDLAGYKLVNSAGVAFTFPTAPQASLLVAGASFVVFNETTKTGTTSAFGTARTFSGLPALKGNGDVVRLLDGTGKEVSDFVSWPFASGSNNRTDATHLVETNGHGADGSVGSTGSSGKFSPGAKKNGTDLFTAGTTSLVLSAAEESGGIGSISLNISLTGGPGTSVVALTATPGLVFANGTTTTTETVTAGVMKTVPMTPVRDADADDTAVTVSAIAPGYLDATTTATVTDTKRNALVITEVNTQGADQFVEILNTSSAPVELDGFTLTKSGSATPVFTFPSTTPKSSIIYPGEAFLVYGSGNDAIKPGVNPALGTARVFKASAPLGLASTGDLVQLTSGGLEYAGMATFPYTGGSNSLSDSLVFQMASSVASPGFKVDGTTPFHTVTDSLSIVYTQPAASELELPGVVKLHVTRPAASPHAAVVQLTATPGVALSSTIVTIPAGATSSEDVMVNPVRDSNTTDETITVTTLSSEYLDSTDSGFVVRDAQVPARFKLDLSASSIIANTGSNAVAVQITLDQPAPAGGLKVTLRLQKPAPADPGTAPSDGLTTVTTVTIPAGATTFATTIAAGAQPVAGEVYELVAIAASPSALGAAASITVNSDEGTTAGPFINEVAVDPQGGGREFVELYTVTPTQALTGLRLVVYSDTGTIVAQYPLSGAAADGRYVIGKTGTPAFGNQSPSFDLPASGAVALYRSGELAAPTADNLIDAFVYGTFTNAAFLKNLLPVVAAGTWTGGTAFAPSGTLGSGVRVATPSSAAGLRQGAAAYTNSAYATLGLPETATAYEVWVTGYTFADPVTGSGFTNDPDHDGLPNGIEFVMGTDPTAAEFDHQPLPTLAAGTWTISYPVSKLAAADALGTARHFDIKIQTAAGTAEGITAWTDATATVPVGGGTLTASVPASGRTFFRLVIGPKAP